MSGLEWLALLVTCAFLLASYVVASRCADRLEDRLRERRYREAWRERRYRGVDE